MFQKQAILIANINLYLRKEIKGLDISNERKGKLEELNSYFSISKGECAGLSCLWSQAKLLASKSEFDTKAKKSLERLKEAHNILYSFNEKAVFSQEKKENIENFISDVFYYQQKAGMVNQEGIEACKVGNDVLGIPNKVFLYDVLTSKEGLEATFDKIILESHMILIGIRKQGFIGHKISIFKDGKSGKISFYDPNLGEKEFDNVKDLVKVLWDAANLSTLISKETLKDFLELDVSQGLIKRLVIEGFNFNPPCNNYPSQKQIGENSFIGCEEILNAFLFSPKLYEISEIEAFTLSFLNNLKDKAMRNDFKFNESFAENKLSEQAKFFLFKFSIENNIKPYALFGYLLKNKLFSEFQEFYDHDLSHDPKSDSLLNILELS